MRTLARWLLRFVLFVLGLGIGLFALLDPQLNRFFLAQESVRSLKDQYEVRTKILLDIDLHRKQIPEVEAMLRKVRVNLPDRIDTRFTAVTDAARRRGVRIEEINVHPSEVLREFYAEREARIKVTGGFHDLGRFAADLAGAPAVILVGDVSLEPAPARMVSMQAFVREFRYRSDEEIAAERQKALAARRDKQ